MADNSIVVELDLDTIEADKKLNNFDTKAKKKGSEAGESFGKGFVTSFLGNLGASLFRDALAGIKNEFGAVVESAKKLEVIEVQFATLLGSTQKAQKQLEDLKKFSASTPFQLEGLSVATRQLLSFGVAQENIIPTLSQIGDLASATGSSIDELTIPYGRLISTQKLTLMELDKFADRGINLFGALSKQTGISLGEIRESISQGKVPFEEFTTALNNLTNKGGMFFGSTVKQSKTLSGVLSTVGDNLFNLRADFGKLFSPLLISNAEETIKTIQKLQKALEIPNINKTLATMASFNDGIINYVIAPLELLANLSGFVGLKVAEGFNAIVASLGIVAGKLGEFLSFIGVDVNEGLQTFAESSNEVFQESAEKANASFNSIFDFPFSTKMSEANEKLREGFTETNEIVENSTKKIDKSLKGIPKALSKVAQGANKIVNQVFAKTISGGIQNVIASLAKGENALDNFGKFLLSSFGDLAIQLGEFYIATGLANLALITKDPTMQIATGASLIALGAILKSSVGGGAGAGGASTSGGALASGDDREESDEDDIEERQVGTNINIEVQGSLVQQDELAQFITEVQNEAREKNGIIDTSVRVV